MVRAAIAAAVVVAALAGCGGDRGPLPASERRGSPASSSEDGGTDLGAQRPAGSRDGASSPRPRLVEHGPRDAKRVALTFDADMTGDHFAELQADRSASPWYDKRIVAELERTRTPATIFMSGLWARAHPEAARRLARSPLYEIANHSLSHRAFDTPCFGLDPVRSRAEKREEVVGSREAIERVTGERTRYFRFPGGCHTKADLRLVSAAGEQPLGWDVVSGDVGQPGSGAIVREVLSGVRPGSIVVMHLVGSPNAPATAEALPRIISGLRERGYSFSTVGDLLRE